jgi:hypothetical protein
MEKISASVGIAKGKPCYNVISDQQKIQALLSDIPPELGGCKGKPAWAAPVWGQCAPDLHQAILTFQKINRFRLDYDPDGHVDPRDATLRLMNDLSASPGLPAHGVPPELDPLDRDIDSGLQWDSKPLFAKGLLVETGWQLEGSGASLNVSASVLTGGGGQWNLSHLGDTYTLNYFFAGGALSPIPVSLSGGPASMKSWGTKLYTYSWRPALALKDLRGPLLIVGAAIDPGVPGVGGYASLIWFNAAMGALAQARLLTAIADKAGLKSKLPGFLQHVNESFGARAALVGTQFMTPDVGLSVTTGMAW